MFNWLVAGDAPRVKHKDIRIRDEGKLQFGDTRLQGDVTALSGGVRSKVPW